MKMVDCFVLFFLLYFIITNKNRLFHALPFCEKQHSAALAHLLHPRSSAKSLRLFIGPVATSNLREQFVPRSNVGNSAKFLIAYAFAYTLNCGHTPTKFN